MEIAAKGGRVKRRAWQGGKQYAHRSEDDDTPSGRPLFVHISGLGRPTIEGPYLAMTDDVLVDDWEAFEK